MQTLQHNQGVCGLWLLLSVCTKARDQAGVCCCLAYVLQGMSITKLRVHLGRAFAAGMVYVGLSRATSLDGLQVGIRAVLGKVRAWVQL